MGGGWEWRGDRGKKHSLGGERKRAKACDCVTAQIPECSRQLSHTQSSRQNKIQSQRLCSESHFQWTFSTSRWKQSAKYHQLSTPTIISATMSGTALPDYTLQRSCQRVWLPSTPYLLRGHIHASSQCLNYICTCREGEGHPGSTSHTIWFCQFCQFT